MKGVFCLFVRNLTGSHHLVAAAAVFKHQGANIHGCRPIENAVAHRKRDKLAIFTIEHADREVRLGVEGVDEKAV